MCCGCWEKYYGQPVISDVVRAAAKAAEHVDPFGCAHAVVDDMNVEDHNIDSAIQRCQKPVDTGWAGYDEDEAGQKVALGWLYLMKQLTEDERATALAIFYGCIPAYPEIWAEVSA